MASTELAILITGKNEASKAVKSLVGDLGGVSGGAKAAGLALAGIAGGAAAGLGGAVAAAAGFEKTMSGVKAVSGATAEEMAQLSGLALQLGKDTSFSASQAAAGLEELVKGGVSIADIMGGAARASLHLAAAGGVELAEAAEIAANALNQFGLKGSDMGRVSDLIAGAANASALSVNDFKFSLKAAGAVAATVGFSFDDLAQAIAVMGKAGITGSDAGTSLKTMMMSLLPNSEKAAGVMKELGIITKDGGNAFFDASGKVKSMAEVAEILRSKTAGLTEAQRLQALETIFGSDAIRAAAVLAKEGAAGFESMAGAMSKVTAESVAAERLNNLSGDIEQLKGSIDTAAITLGTTFLPVLRGATQGATGFANALTPIIEKHGPLLVGALERVGGAFEGVFGIARGLFLAFTVDAGAMGLVLGHVREMFGDTVADGVQPFLHTVMEAIPGIRAFASELAGVAGKLVDGNLPALLLGIGGALAVVFGPPVLGLIGAVWAALWAILLPVAAITLGVVALKTAWEHNLGGIQQKARELLGVVAPAFGELAGVVRQALSGDVAGALGGFLGVVGGIADRLVPVLARWGAAFVAWVGPMVPPLLQALGSALASLGGWLLGTAVPAIVGKLAEWGKAFIAWVGPMIPPLLRQLGTVAAGIFTWVVAQVPALAGVLAGWAEKFFAWVEPALRELLREAGLLADALMGWIGEQVPVLAETFASQWVPAAIAWVEKTVRDLLPKLGDLAVALLDWIAQRAPTVAETFIGEWVPAAIGWVARTTTDLLPKLLEMLVAIADWVESTGKPRLFAFFTELGTAMLRGILKGLETLGKQLVDAISAAIRAINIDFGWIRISGTSGITFNIPAPPISWGSGDSPPGRAAGGPVAAGYPYIVGERGPELFVPRMSGAIIPTHRIRASVSGSFVRAAGTSGGGDSPVVVNVYGNVYVDDLEDRVVAAVHTAQRRGRLSLVAT